MGIVAVAITPLLPDIAKSLTIPSISTNPLIAESKKRLVQVTFTYYKFNGNTHQFNKEMYTESVGEYHLDLINLTDEQWEQLEKDFQQ